MKISFKFHDLIDPKISLTFCGLYLSVFRRDKWIKNLGVVNKKFVKTWNIFYF